jgi:uncharacterized protein
MDLQIKYNYAIYHKNCLDGFSSLILLLKSKQLSDDAIIYPDIPSSNLIPKNINNKNIIIMDVAYKYDVLKNIIDNAKSVIFIDHHITINNDVKKLKLLYNDKLTIIYDEYECGATLTWKFLFPTRKIPLFIKYIKDNDIGEWKLKNTHAFIYALRVKFDLDLKKETIKKWRQLFKKENVKELIKLGKIYEEYAQKLLNDTIKKHSIELFPSKKIYEKYINIFDKPGQYKVAVINGSGCPSSSLVGNKLIEMIDCDFALLWNYNINRKKYILSFRSKEVNVGEIAELFGGGGHKLASACSFTSDKYNINELFLNNLSLKKYKNKNKK